ncbi:MAG: hypothetical protein B7Y16_00370 [Methylotenera sp. 24-45-7]|jgi:hypothetical protein|nr:MAG: hypothetical protein B7Y16_00370 [Methylotenera sp. 24-45-7]OZA08856.1 MAG: hypothetical protein B7X97_04815 [Methylotenera sp. 17-45-7]OZA53110.1 MAG: hypothetical protein B7X73_05710 [Methylophilales bacterium 39-45-7]HQS43318.1 hypothetical protein [Methylotenera sp.]
MTTNITQPLPSLPQLIKATALALIVAGVILITIVLPAEFGIDPTGSGKALGLTALNDSSRQIQPAALAIEEAVSIPPNTIAVEPVEQLLTSTVVKSGAPFRSDEMTITLQEDEGSEIKALMKKGEQFVFTWTTDGGKVNFDMHGEQPNAGEAFTSYWKDKNQTNANGTFVAPFDGTHGWYWRNRGDKPVTIKVKVSGFYNKLYQPE